MSYITVGLVVASFLIGVLAFRLFTIYSRKKGNKRNLIREMVLDQLSELVWIKGVDGRYKMCNSSFEHFMGVKEKELIGKTDYEIQEREIADRFVANDRKVMAGGKAISYEEKVVFATDGKERFVKSMKKPLYTAEGELIGVLGIARDISEHKDNVERMHTSERMLRNILNTIPVRVFWKDTDGKYMGVNDLFASDAGMDNEAELVGLYDFDMPWMEQAERYRSDDKLVMETDSPKITYEEPQSDGKGGSRWLRTSKIPLRDQEGKVYGILGTYEDITERKQIELELEKHREQLEQLVADRTRELSIVNEELQMVNTNLEQSLRELKDTQAQLIQVEKMASLGILTAGVAHEINNPLNFISGGYQGLIKYFQEDGGIGIKEVPFLLESVKTGVERATEIVRGLNQFSRSTHDLDEACDIHSILEDCILILHNRLKNHVQLERDFWHEDLIIPGNVGQLHQVFLNIIANAEQAIQESGSIRISTRLSEEMVRVEISDTGHGIAKSDLERVTDPFFTTKAPGEGTGLGLSISYTIVQDHKGQLLLDSEPGKGTRITVLLPT